MPYRSSGFGREDQNRFKTFKLKPLKSKYHSLRECQTYWYVDLLIILSIKVFISSLRFITDSFVDLNMTFSYLDGQCEDIFLNCTPCCWFSCSTSYLSWICVQQTDTVMEAIFSEFTLECWVDTDFPLPLHLKSIKILIRVSQDWGY